MSVRIMTTDQLKKDLEVIARTWGNAVPPEQADRVNALYGELKRRGVDAKPGAPVAPAPAEPEQSLSDMSDKDLEKALRELSERIAKSPTDDALQERFADIRFEMRNRVKKPNGNGNQSQIAQVVQEMEADRTMQTVQPAQERLVPRAQQEIAAKNAAVMEDMRKTHLDTIKAQTAALVASRLITDSFTGDLRMVDGDQIAAAVDVGIAVASQVFEKVGL